MPKSFRPFAEVASATIDPQNLNCFCPCIHTWHPCERWAALESAILASLLRASPSAYRPSQRGKGGHTLLPKTKYEVSARRWVRPDLLLRVKLPGCVALIVEWMASKTLAHATAVSFPFKPCPALRQVCGSLGLSLLGGEIVRDFEMCRKGN